MSFATNPRDVQGILTGGQNTSPSISAVLNIMVIALHGQIRTVAIATNGVGNADTVIDLRINGVSAYTNPANRPTVPNGSAAYKAFFSRPNKRAVRPGDILTLVVVAAANNVGVAATAVIEYPESQP